MSSLSKERRLLVEQLSHSLRQTSQLLLKSLQATVQEDASTSVGECMVLYVLLHKGPLSQRAIAQELHHSEAAISRQVSLALANGTIESKPDPHDRRSYQISITPKGTEKIQQIMDKVTTTLARNLSPLTDQQLKEYIEANRRLQQALSEQSINKESIDNARP